MELKQLAFSYITIMLKMHHAENNISCTVSISDLFVKATEQEVAHADYPTWIAKELVKASS